MAASLSLTSEAPRLLTIMSCSLATMSFGVPAGATTAVQVAPTTSGKPASAMVGTSGSVGARSLPVTASARKPPLLISGSAGANAPNEIGVWPPTVASTAGSPPPNGTCTRSSFNACANSEPTSCGGVPVPGEAKLYLPGCERIKSTSSLTVCAGTDGLTASTTGDDEP